MTDARCCDGLPNSESAYRSNISILFIDAGNQGNMVLINTSDLGEKIKDGKKQKTVLTWQEKQCIIDVFNGQRQEEDFSVVVDYE
ncbi:hypothetical protein [Candidatus Methylobacter oryzae]|uniref:Uncharacterized protein n=1 Tax=Candidatus Methylobacter oryzae TaxID=2497749 RepID=A0ABY3CAK1_9GAMM|nr:hypothetical protein [Candidatus Methylobacter oryzae]TRW95386.1 hypothetical protein EKO24_010015 [Candidatus Methylobacter oryzae]